MKTPSSVTCTVCAQTAILDKTIAESLFTVAQGALQAQGIDCGKRKYKLHFSNRRDLSERTGSESHLGWTDYRKVAFLGGLISSKTINIYVLEGMPASQFIHVAAHELMHVWLFDHKRLSADPQFTEGSCEYAGLLVITHLALPDVVDMKRRMLRNADTTYGSGFRKVAQYVSENGVEAWLEYAKSNDDAPWE